MKKTFKPLVILMMSFILCIPMLATSVFGTETTEIAPAEHEIQGSLRIDEPIVLPYSEPDSPEISYYGAIAPASEADTLFAMEELMKEALLNGETMIDLEPYNISRDRINLTLSYVFSPYISGNINVAVYVYQSGQYAYMTLDNPMSIEETAEYFDEVDNKVAELRAMVANGKTEAEKCLILHDYFVYNAEYDYDNYLNNTIPNDSFRSCGVMMKNVGVCQSYASCVEYCKCRRGILSGQRDLG